MAGTIGVDGADAVAFHVGEQTYSFAVLRQGRDPLAVFRKVRPDTLRVANHDYEIELKR